MSRILPLIPVALALPVTLAACLPLAKRVPTGAEDFATYCAACHGDSGDGKGVLIGTLNGTPANLTRLAAANGGKFPMAHVMSKIWDNGGRSDRHVMPEFADLFDPDDLVLFDSGDGIQTPTPRRLAQLGEYLQGIQAK
ncbi:MAG: cytochrome c [Gemmobacter sp.]|jgi:mono/diheme cytochrome c family protein|nr:cytochrome c [Gemmobacter sp.]